MIHHHPSVYQALECFGVGLLVCAAAVVAIVLVAFLLHKIEKPVERWFLSHPRGAKGVVVGGWAFAVCAGAGFLFWLGCSIMEGM
jgi:multisubunit Na+/H+ antiporter MnhB subunit